MPDAVTQYLEREMDCEGLLECFYGLTDLDRAVYTTVTGGGPVTVDEVAAQVNRERSTAYRSLQRLVEAGLVVKRRRTDDDGGYYHVFRAADADEVADDFHRTLNDWYAKMGRLIGEFEDKYDDPPRTE